MIIDTTNNWRSPIRHIAARVELYFGSTLVESYTAQTAIKSLSIERLGESNKFFGYGVTQKLNLELIDKDRAINITTNNTLKVYLNAGGDDISFPSFYVNEVNRDEKTNQLSITALDAILMVDARGVKLNDLGILFAPYTLLDAAEVCATVLQATLKVDDETAFALNYEEGANLSGSEKFREVMTGIAEATQTIYFITGAGELYFKRLDKDGEAQLTIGKEDYFELESGDSYRLGKIISTTELGDNLIASDGTNDGATQYIKNNPFWDLREDRASLVDNALEVVSGLTINQFTCDWRGNPALEIGDKIDLIKKDNTTITSYLLNDTISFTGALKQESNWSYKEEEAEAANPTSLGEAIKQTYAKVDKANQEIEIAVVKTEENYSNLTAIQLNIDSINSTVQHTQAALDDSVNDLNGKIEDLSTQIEQLPDKINFTIKEEIQENGVEKVTTATGFTFDEKGLSISKTGTEITTQITENGMTVYKNDTEMLTANSAGVKALDLHATTFLIIGQNSRFEDYAKNGEARTACFYIGN